MAPLRISLSWNTLFRCSLTLDRNSIRKLEISGFQSIVSDGEKKLNGDRVHCQGAVQLSKTWDMQTQSHIHILRTLWEWGSNSLAPGTAEMSATSILSLIKIVAATVRTPMHTIGEKPREGRERRKERSERGEGRGRVRSSRRGPESLAGFQHLFIGWPVIWADPMVTKVWPL